MAINYQEATYVSATQFTVVGNYTHVYKDGRRVVCNDATEIEGDIDGDSTFGGGVTTVNVSNVTLTGALTGTQVSRNMPGATGNLSKHPHDGTEGNGGPVSYNNLTNKPSLVTSLLDLTDTPATYSGSGEKAVLIKIGEDGVEFGDVSVVATILDLTDTPGSYENLKYLRSTTSGTEWDEVVSTWLALTDTPVAYDVSKFCKSTASGIELANIVEADISDLQIYVLPDGSVGFTNTISGTYPVNDEHLVTKEYADKIAAAQLAGTPYFLHDHADATVSGYESLLRQPGDEAEGYDEVTIKSSNGETFIDQYITVSGEPNTTHIPAGVWTLNCYGYVDSNTGDSRLRGKVYKRSAAGAETLLVTMTSPELVATGPTLYICQTSTSGIDMLATDRLALKMYAETSSGSNRDIRFYYEGSENATFLLTPVITNFSLTHGDMNGLDADDHPQYHNDTRGDARYLLLTGGTINGDMTIYGDLTVSGTTFTTEHETVLINDNLLVINNGEVGPGVTVSGLEAGIEVDRGSSTNYKFIFDEATDTFRIGEVGDLQPVATREDSPTNSGIAYWNNDEVRFDASDTKIGDLVTTEYIDSITSGVYKEGVVTVTSGVAYEDVYFPQTMPGANYSVICTMGTTTSGSMTMWNMVIGPKTADYFRINFTGTVDNDATYVSWHATLSGTGPGAGGGLVQGVTTHGGLTGNDQDDHPQYHNDARAATWFTDNVLDDTAGNGDTDKVYSADKVYDLLADKADVVHDHNGETIVVGDHGTDSTDQVINACYGTGSPPTASDTTEGAVFFKHEA